MIILTIHIVYMTVVFRSHLISTGARRENGDVIGMHNVLFTLISVKLSYVFSIPAHFHPKWCRWIVAFQFNTSLIAFLRRNCHKNVKDLYDYLLWQ